MLKYQKYQNKNEESKAYGKWYARLDGKKVKIDNLGLFYPSIHTTGADSPEKFTIAKNLKALRMRVLGTGNFSSSEIRKKARFTQDNDYEAPETKQETEIQNP